MKKFVIPLFLFLFIPILTQAGPIRWQSYQDGLKKAKAESKKVFLNFHADW
jgi:thiol:disulfide interchange protein